MIRIFDFFLLQCSLTHRQQKCHMLQKPTKMGVSWFKTDLSVSQVEKTCKQRSSWFKIGLPRMQARPNYKQGTTTREECLAVHNKTIQHRRSLNKNEPLHTRRSSSMFSTLSQALRLREFSEYQRCGLHQR